MKHICQLIVFHWSVIKPNSASQLPLQELVTYDINISVSVLPTKNSGNCNDNCSQKRFNSIYSRYVLPSFLQLRTFQNTYTFFCIYPQCIHPVGLCGIYNFVSFLYYWAWMSAVLKYDTKYTTSIFPFIFYYHSFSL